jgi:hypothetical protein
LKKNRKNTMLPSPTINDTTKMRATVVMVKRRLDGFT